MGMKFETEFDSWKTAVCVALALGVVALLTGILANLF